MATTPCPDCGARVPRGPRAKIYRTKQCDQCRDARQRRSRARWKADNREQVKIAARIPGVVGRTVACQRCGDSFPRAGGRGRDPKWCRECRTLRNAEIQVACRARNPEKSRDLSKAGTARRRGAARISIELVVRAVVYDRDGWVCGLCAIAVDRGLAWPDPMSPSLDHIVPLSLGGAHTYTNVQLSHLRCNLAKGNRVAVAS